MSQKKQNKTELTFENDGSEKDYIPGCERDRESTERERKEVKRSKKKGNKDKIG